MDRKSRELFQSGDEVEIGVYRSLKSGRLVRIRHVGEKLPEETKGHVDTYEWITGHPDWEEEEQSEH